MARLPDTYGKRPTPKFGRPDQARPYTHVDSGDQDVAQGLQSLGDSLIRLQIRDDKYRVDNATTKLEERVLEITKGEQGYTGVKEGNVDDKFIPTQMGRYNAAVDEVAKSLKGSNQTDMFRRRAEVMSNRFQESVIDHVTRENEAFQKSTYENGVRVDIEMAVNAWDKPNQINAYKVALQKRINDRAAEEGLSEEERVVELLDATSAVNLGVIAQAVDNDQAGYAEEWFAENREQMNEADEMKANKLIKVGSALKQAQDNLDGYITGKMNVTQMREAARELEGEERKQTLTLIDNYHLDQKQQEKLGWDEARRVAFEYANNGAPVPTSVRAAMNPQELYSFDQMLKQAAKGESIQTNYPKYIKLLNEAKADPEKFATDRKLEKNLWQLEDKHRDKLIAIMTKDPKVNDTLYGPSGILNQVILGAGWDPKVLEDTNDDPDGDPEQARKFAREFMEELDKMGNWTEKDALDLGAQKAIKYRRETSAFPEWMQRTHRKLSKDDDPILPWSVFGDDLIPAGRGDINDMPNDRIDDISKMLEDANIPVTERNILFTYQERKSRGLED